MAVFKSKKTYIKRYASKNTDKKIKFADSITAEFGSGGKKIKAASSYAKTDVASEKPKVTATHSDETRFDMNGVEYRPKYRFTSIEGDGLVRPAEAVNVSENKKEDMHDTVVSENISEEPRLGSDVIEVDNQEPEEIYFPSFNEEIIENEPAQESLPLGDVSFRADTQAEDEVYEAEAESEGHTAVALAKKPTEEAQEDTALEEAHKEKAELSDTNENRQPKAKKNVFSVVMKVVCIMAVIALGGYLGKDFVNEQIERARKISEELSIVYAPEDYVYPEIPSSVAQKVKAARDAAYNQAMADAYVPGRAEVPNLYKYDYVKTCYLTFDDGPSAEVTSSILDTLKKYNVPATFFVVGKNAEEYPELIKRMDAEGHSIGNHSYSHNYEYMYSGDPEFDSEMIACKNAINNILGRNYGNMLYRFPGGSFEVYKQYYIWNIESEGYQYVDWTALTGDSEVQSPDAEYIMNTLKESTNNGTKEDIVVLMHDAGAKKITADTLPQVIEYLKSKNYVFKAIKNSNFISE